MAGRFDIDPVGAGLDPDYDYAAVERIAVERARASAGLTRSALLHRATGLFLAIGPLGALLAACGGDEEPSAGEAAGGATATAPEEAPASLEGMTVNFYSWQGYDLPELSGDWAGETGVRLNARYFATNEDILTALRSGGGESQYNLSSYYAGQGPQYRELGVAPPIDVSQVPNAEQLYPFLAEEPLAPYWREGDEWWGIPFTFGGNLGLYDTAVISSAPTSWNDFLKPEWKNKYVIVDDALATFFMGAHLVGSYNIETQYTEAQAQEIFDVLTPFKENARTIATYGQVPDLFASEEIQGATSSWAAIANQAAAKGKTTIKPFLPEEGANSFLDVWFTPPSNNPDDLPAVLAFMDFSISPEAQANAAKTLSGGVLRQDAEALLDEQTKSLYPYDDIAGFFESAPVGAQFPVESDEFVTQAQFDTLWNTWKGA
jgi:spermidine/putrescine transport system substrate-binding protein